MADSEDVSKYRRSLVAVASVAVIYQLGWIGPSDAANGTLGLEIVDQRAVGKIVALAFIYFFIAYHQRLLYGQSEEFKEAWKHVRKYFEANLRRAVDARIDAKSDQPWKSASLLYDAKAGRLTFSPEELSMWFWSREIRFAVPNSQGKQEGTISIQNWLWWRGGIAWLRALAITPFFTEAWLPSLWALVPIILLHPTVRTLALWLVG